MAVDHIRRGLLAGAASLPLLAPRTLAAKPKRKLGVALVGLGYYSRDLLAPALQLTQHCELRGIVTGSPEKIPIWQRQYKIPDGNVYNYQNMAKIADNDDIDVVYIVLPTFMHKDYAVLAANAGKHVWCEKPMAMTVGECHAIIDACRKNKVKLAIGYRMQHEPNTQTVIGFADSQPYGAQQGIIAKAGYRSSGGPQSDWRMNRSQGGGALYDMGVYPINAARYASGLEPVAVSAVHKIHRPELFINADETTEFTLEFGNGLRANCATSVGENYNLLRVNCARGWYQLQPMQAYSGVVGQTSDGRKLDTFIANQQAAQMDNDALAIREDTNVMVPGEEGLLDIRVVEGALKSAANEGAKISLS